MKLEKKYLLIVLLALALALPVSLALGHRAHLLKIEKSKNNTLQLQLNSKQKELQLKNTQIQQEQQKNTDLQKQLQSKKDTAQKVASAQAQAQVTAPVAVASAGGNCEAYRGIVAQYNWNVSTAMAVMRAESGCNPTATSPTCDHGLMQINCVHAAAVGGDLTLLNDPATNVRVAFAVYSGAGGWSPWTTFTSGAYLRYL